MSTQYSACSSTDQTGHSPSSARASSTQVTSAVIASAMSGLQLGSDPLAHPPVHGVGLLLPAEHADRRHAVEVQLPQGREELVPVDVAVADLVVLVDADVRAGRIDDVPMSLPQLVVVAIGDVQVLRPVPGVLQHPADVPGTV